MRTYLGFKRTLIDPSTGYQKTETKFIPVNIPELDSSQGWKLIGSSDIVEVLPMLTQEERSEVPFVEEHVTVEVNSSKDSKLPLGSTFESPVSGTAKLVRAKNEIFIAYRRGKKGLNETSPNSVCISEDIKSKFFAECRRAFGRSCDTYKFVSGCSEFDYWNMFIDVEYNRQLMEVNSRVSSRT